MSNMFQSPQGGASTSGQPEYAKKAGSAARRDLMSGRQFVADWTPEQTSLYNNFFQTTMPQLQNTLGGQLQFDALGTIQNKMQPSRSLALGSAQRDLGESMGAAGWGSSSNSALGQSDLTARTLAGYDATDAAMIPGIMQTQQNAVQGMEGLNQYGMNLGNLLQQHNQNQLDYVLKALMALASGGGSQSFSPGSYGPSAGSQLLDIGAMLGAAKLGSG